MGFELFAVGFKPVPDQVLRDQALYFLEIFVRFYPDPDDPWDGRSRESADPGKDQFLRCCGRADPVQDLFQNGDAFFLELPRNCSVRCRFCTAVRRIGIFRTDTSRQMPCMIWFRDSSRMGTAINNRFITDPIISSRSHRAGKFRQLRRLQIIIVLCLNQ